MRAGRLREKHDTPLSPPLQKIQHGKVQKKDTKSDGMKPLILSMGVCDETEYKNANINFPLHTASAQHERPLYIESLSRPVLFKIKNSLSRFSGKKLSNAAKFCPLYRFLQEFLAKKTLKAGTTAGIDFRDQDGRGALRVFPPRAGSL